MTAPTVDLLDLASAALSASIVAADQITALARQRDAAGSAATATIKGPLNIRLKDDGSFVTNADLLAQQIIVQSLHQVSTDVRLVGEESEEEMAQHTITGHEERAQEIFQLARTEIRMRYQQAERESESTSAHLPLAQTTISGESLPGLVLNTSTSSSITSLLKSTPLPEHVVEASRVSVFIDPLDGTKAYARGDYGPVSILIAIILDQVPCFGVICKPFGYERQPSVLDTECVAFYGGTLLGAAYTAGGGYCTKSAPSSPMTVSKEPPLERPPTMLSASTVSVESSVSTMTASVDDLPRAVISSSRSGGIVEEFVNHLGSKGMIHPTPVHISGAGEKSLRILLRSEKEGLWFFPKAGTSLWDVAASDALLRATGGRLTDKNGKDMDYSKTRLEAENEDGVVACYDRALHAECIKLFLEGTWTAKS